MRGFVAVLVMLLAVGRVALADQPLDISTADRTAIQSVIQGQIEAFRHDDADTAFAAAAPNIQMRFGSSERFLGIVRQLYQPVYRPQRFAFGDLVTEDGELIQKVEVVGPDGARATALYSMVKLPDGSWRIAGCKLLKSEDRDT